MRHRQPVMMRVAVALLLVWTTNSAKKARTWGRDKRVEESARARAREKLRRSWHPKVQSLAMPARGVDACGGDGACASDLIRALDACAGENGAVRPETCGNLCPAGTGTLTLKDALLATPAAFAHHSHRVGLPDLHDMTATASLAAKRRDGSDFDGKRRGGARCLFVTLREPAARLESAYRHSQLRFKPRHDPPALDGVLEAWRGRVAGGAAAEAELPPQILVDFFLPQAAYVKPAPPHCAAGDLTVHVLCTTTLATDWAAAATAKLGLAAPPRIDPAHSKHVRSSGAASTSPEKRAYVARVQGRSKIANASTRRWINEELYPTDTALFRHFCEPRIAAATANGTRSSLQEAMRGAPGGKRRAPLPAEVQASLRRRRHPPAGKKGHS